MTKTCDCVPPIACPYCLSISPGAVQSDARLPPGRRCTRLSHYHVDADHLWTQEREDNWTKTGDAYARRCSVVGGAVQSDAAALAAGETVPPGHCNRCIRCGWPLAVGMAYGCVPESCSMRPQPATRRTCACGKPYASRSFDGLVQSAGPLPQTALATAAETDRCDTCDLPLASDTDYDNTKEGEGQGLCWREWNDDVCNGPRVDWRERALQARRLAFHEYLRGACAWLRSRGADDLADSLACLAPERLSELAKETEK